jgi:predicted nucleic acid-binding protein
LADPPKRVCWDACAWIGFIAGEPDKIRPLRMIWDSAQRGGYEIWTSTYAYLEVLKIRAEGGDPIPIEESNRMIDEMFQQPHVKRVQLDVEVARLARAIKQKYHDAGLKSRPDSIYVATAAYYNLDELHTWDKQHLLPFDGLILRRDGKPLRILIPGPEVVGPLFAEVGLPTPEAGEGGESERAEAPAESAPSSEPHPPSTPMPK